MWRVWTIGACLLLAACGGSSVRRSPPPASAPAVAAPASPEAQRALFVQAHTAVGAGRYVDAIPALNALCPAYSQMADYCLRDLAVSYAGTGDVEQADVMWARLLTTQPQSIFVPRAALERGRLQRRAGDTSAARALLTAARGSEDREVALQALLELAELELTDGNTDAALRDLTAARADGIGTASGAAARRRIDELRRADPRLIPQGSAAADEARLLLKEREYAAAAATAEQALGSAPTSERPALLRVRAEAELGAGRIDDGLATLQQIVREYPESAAAPEAQFRYAALLWNRNRNDEAERAYVELLRRYPTNGHVPEALYALARISQGERRDAEAIARYQQLADEYPDTPLGREAGWRIGWISYQQGRYRDAAAAFARAAAGGSAANALESEYWRARALERAGDRGAAQELYRSIIAEAPASYYALWATQRLGAPPATTGAVAAPDPPTIGPPPAGADPYHWQRATELQAMGMRGAARTELKTFERNNELPATVPAVLRAYQAADGYRDAIRLASAQGLTDREIFFPLAFWPQVTRHTRGTDIDPLLVLALMRQESMFDPSARSSADARGLMQLLPSTAEAVAQRTGQPSPAGKLYDPDTNITLGVAHVHELLGAYQGDPVKVLAAYNGGPEAVARWQRQFGGLEPDEFVESITYRETRDYVKRVLGNYRRYQQEYRN